MIPSAGDGVANWGRVSSLKKYSQEATHSDIGRGPVREVRISHEVSNSGNSTSIKRPEICGVSVLPVIPDLIDHLAVKTC